MDNFFHYQHIIADKHKKPERLKFAEDESKYGREHGHKVSPPDDEHSGKITVSKFALFAIEAVIEGIFS